METLGEAGENGRDSESPYLKIKYRKKRDIEDYSVSFLRMQYSAETRTTDLAFGKTKLFYELDSGNITVDNK